MSADTIPACAEGQTAGALSSWRDGALNPVESERLSRHLTECAACRARLAEYDDIADGLRAIRVPDPIGGYRRDPRASSAPRRGRSWRSLRATPRMRVAGSVGAVAAVLLIALAFAQVFVGLHHIAAGTHTPTMAHATVTATVNVTPVALPPLAWHVLPPLPDGSAISGSPYTTPGPLLFGTTGMIAPSDGTTAYACAMQPPYSGGPPPMKALFFATHDTAQTWSPILTIPAEHGATECVVTVDALNPTVVLASSAYAFRTVGPSPNSAVTYLSQDGGAHWQRLPGDQLIVQPATRQGVTYALHEVQTGTFSNAPTTVNLAVSRDGMRTWTAIDGALMLQSGHTYMPQQFWLNPNSGNLLLETMDQANSDALTLWHSEDAGAHWQSFEQPLATNANPNYVVQAPVAGQPWHVCVAGYRFPGQGQNTLACTLDNGATWNLRTALEPPYGASVSGKGPVPSIGAPVVFAVSNDGAVLAVAAQGVAADGSITGYALYRLPQGASQWQSLGSVPEYRLLYVPAPASGILWAVPDEQFPIDPHNRVFTVPYA